MRCRNLGAYFMGMQMRWVQRVYSHISLPRLRDATSCFIRSLASSIRRRSPCDGIRRLSLPKPSNTKPSFLHLGYRDTSLRRWFAFLRQAHLAAGMLRVTKFSRQPYGRSQVIAKAEIAEVGNPMILSIYQFVSILNLFDQLKNKLRFRIFRPCTLKVLRPVFPPTKESAMDTPSTVNIIGRAYIDFSVRSVSYSIDALHRGTIVA